MTSWMVAPIAFALMMIGATMAIVLARRAPEDFLSDKTQDTFKVTVGITATMTSLLLGLMTNSMRYSYAGAEEDVQQYAVALLTADVELRHFGEEACPARHELAEYVRLIISETWTSDEHLPSPQFETSSANQLLKLDTMVRALKAVSDDQKVSRANAKVSMKSLLTHRWRLTGDAESRIPPLFIIVVMGWLTLIFTSFGWFAPVNPPSVLALICSAAAISAALFLVVEMGEPFTGPMRIAPAPLLDALHAMEAHPCAGPLPPAATAG